MTLVQEATEIDVPAVAADDAVLQVRNLTTEIKNRAGTLRPVNEVSFDVTRARCPRRDR